LGWLADNETYDIQNPDDGDGVGVRNVWWFETLDAATKLLDPECEGIIAPSVSR
jgi:hypothetical protein